VIGGNCAAPGSAPLARGAGQDRRPAGARRAPRALEKDVEKVVTTFRQHPLSASNAGDFRWSDVYPQVLVITKGRQHVFPSAN